jgi:hypothetical protein
MIKTKEYIKELFLRMTSRTVPYGEEDRFVDDVMPLLFPKNIKKDQHGNYFYKIGESRTIFASHLDTVSKKYERVTHIIDGDIIRTDGKTTLGADDKAGVTVMLYMIENQIPGLYYFFIGEEVGCIGSGFAAQYGDFKGKYDRIISFDRRNTGSVITHQSSGRCCSDNFANFLCEEFNNLGMNYKKDSGGVYTDSAEFVDIIPECTNISVGYYKEHTVDEHQDINHLTKLAIACTKVDWENSPVERDPSVREYYDRYSSGFGYSSKSYGFHDDWFVDESDYDRLRNEFDYSDNDLTKKTRRSGKKNKKKGRVFYDGGTDLIDMTEDFTKNSDDRYDWIINKFVNDQFTWDELMIIKEYYLDMNTEYDKYFFEYLCEQVVDV